MPYVLVVRRCPDCSIEVERCTITRHILSVMIFSHLAKPARVRASRMIPLPKASPHSSISKVAPIASTTYVGLETRQEEPPCLPLGIRRPCTSSGAQMKMPRVQFRVERCLPGHPGSCNPIIKGVIHPRKASSPHAEC